jgi:hypothetical protein
MKTRLSCLLIALALPGACDEPFGTPQRTLIDAVTRRPPPYTTDSVFFALNQQVPGFAGFYFDREGALHVQTTVTSNKDAAIAAVTRFRSAFTGPNGERGAGRIIPHTVRYNFAELFAWKSAVYGAMRLGLAHAVDADEVTNTVTVFVETRAQIGKARVFLLGRGIPEDALIVLAQPKAVPMVALTDRVRPVSAGLMISKSNGSCTLGPLVQYDSQRAAIVNSHCTNASWTGTGTVFYQPTYLSYRLGVEVADTNTTPNQTCPSGYNYCRYSETAIVALDDSVSYSFSTVLATSSTSTDSTGSTIGSTKTVTATADVVTDYVGQTLYKTGVTTGTTYGTLVRTDLDVNWATSQFLCCQSVVQAGIRPGDSGSPVWRDVGSSSAELHGIAWGGYPDQNTGLYYFEFSSVLGIVLDYLGAWNNNTQSYEHTFTWY